MSEEIEQKLLQEIEELKRKIGLHDSYESSDKPVFQYSKIRDNDLNQLVNIEKKIRTKQFDKWFEYNYEISQELRAFFQEIINDNVDLIEEYSEEDLKVNVIIPILNKVKFKSFENEFRDFYELPIRYEADNFIFNGTTDFVVSKGLIKSKRPYFFIQEFKKGEEYTNPRPQLLAELISAVELNNWDTIKGAYIVGAIWHFVILERLEKHTYHYFVSQNFDATKIDDLEKIYTNLIFVKNEIIEKIEKEKL